MSFQLVAKKIVEKGGEIFMHHKVVGVENDKNIFESVLVKDEKLGIEKTYKGDYFFSTMPISILIQSLGNEVVDSIYYIGNHWNLDDPYNDNVGNIFIFMVYYQFKEISFAG